MSNYAYTKRRCETDPEYHEKRRTYYRTLMKERYYSEAEIERRQTEEYQAKKHLHYLAQRARNLEKRRLMEAAEGVCGPGVLTDELVATTP